MQTSEQIIINHIHELGFIIKTKTRNYIYKSIAAYYKNCGFIGYKNEKSLCEIVQFFYENHLELLDELKFIDFDNIHINVILLCEFRDPQWFTEKWYQCVIRLLKKEFEIHNSCYVLK
jgi:hypothetical protein